MNKKIMEVMAHKLEYAQILREEKNKSLLSPSKKDTEYC